MEPQDYLSFLPYTFIILIMISCWIIRQQSPLIIASVLLILSCLATGGLEVYGALILLSYGTVTYTYFSGKLSKPLRTISGILFFILSLCLMARICPGFNGVTAIDYTSESFNISLHLEKPFVGLALLIFLNIEKIKNLSEATSVFKKFLPIYLSLMLLIIPTALFMNYVDFDPKAPSLWWLWSLKNLFLVCVAEELFFRGFIQNKLKYMNRNYKYGSSIAILSASILFGLAHYKGGISYIALSTIAGLFYGTAFEKTNRIEASIMVHFLLNLAHFFLFSYPSLQSS